MEENELRRLAENELQRSGWRPPSGRVPADAAKEIEVLQTEVAILRERLAQRSQELDASVTYCETLYDLAPVALLVLDDHHKIADANASATTLLGGRAIEGKPLIDFVEEGDAPLLDEKLRWPDRTTLPTVIFRRTDGERIHLRVEIVQLGTANQGHRSIVGLVDLTEQAQLQEQLVQAQRLEAVGTLAAGVAHDFNNVLMGMSGALALACRRVGEDHPARTHLDQISESVQSGAEIASQLLAFARRKHARKELCSVDAILRKLHPLFETILGEDVETCLDLRSDAGFVRAAPSQLEQVFMNLAVNARDAMPQGGSLHIGTSLEWLGRREAKDDLPPGEYLRLTVKDTGTGISDEIRPKIFEPFFTTKQPGRGTGLGLSMAYGIITSFGGQISVDSVPGEGTTFTIVLPIDHESHVGLEELSSLSEYEPHVATTKGTVLVVEDHSLVRATVVGYLEDARHEVLGARDVSEAHAILREHGGEIDVIVTDTVLPDGSGADVSELAAEISPGIGVIFMSAHGHSLLVERFQIPKDVAFLQKPFQADELCRYVARALIKAQQ